MRIVIDLQAAQSNGSKNRGIGRYAVSLTKAILRNHGTHEIFIALNGSFLESIETIRTSFEGLIPQSQIVVWPALAGVDAENPNNEWRRHAAELLRESFLNNLKPDVVLVSSLFEGLGEDVVTSIGCMPVSYKTAVILYDLIPYICRHPYLDHPRVAAWYMDKIGHLRRSDLLLSISASSRQEAIDHLGSDENRTVNISSDADACFRKLNLPEDEIYVLQQRYGLTRAFVMYTGGIDHRKNIEGLIRSFSRLPETLREKFQLAIVCSVNPEKRKELLRLATDCGLNQDDVVMTGFVPENDLVALYNLCTLFVFPSLHEGFGLPALEAMRCGAPVIASNTSSLPEVIGNRAALFDPYSEIAISNALEQALIDQDFRSILIEQSATQSARFSWDESAKQAMSAMTQTACVATPRTISAPSKRLKLAYVSPLPPERSGIADYSAELLPALAAHYDIDVIVDQSTITTPSVLDHCKRRTVDWFAKNAGSFDRIIYHFGNSAFHKHMFDLLKAHPGVVVLHDFYLSGVAAYMEVLNLVPGFWTRALLASHGYSAVRERFHSLKTEDVAWQYPCSLGVLQDSLGIITHSASSKSLAREWYGVKTDDWATIPLMRDPNVQMDKKQARIALGFGSDDFLVCSFGMLGPTKLNHRLLDAWLNSELSNNPQCHLIFVGENFQGYYGVDLEEKIRTSHASSRISITGWVDSSTFRQYLSAADIGVQLRGLSRGETSATVLDCMNHSLATIANANGSMADLDPEALWLLQDAFTDSALTDALNTLWRDAELRTVYGERGRALILKAHNPEICAQEYATAIENFYSRSEIGLHHLIPLVAKLARSGINDSDFVSLANAIDRGFPQAHKPKQLLIDVTSLFVDPELPSDTIDSGIENLLRQVITSPPAGYRVDLIYTRKNEAFRYARKLALKLLGCPANALNDDFLEYLPNDAIIHLHTRSLSHHHNQLIETLKAYGVHSIEVEDDLESFLERTTNWSELLPTNRNEF